jgi:hypothetical protein
MPLRFVYLAFCATLRFLVRARLGEVEREAELLILRDGSRCFGAPRGVHGSARQTEPHSRLARLLRPQRRHGLIVLCATLLRRHRDLARRRRRHSTVPRADRRSIPGSRTSATCVLSDSVEHSNAERPHRGHASSNRPTPTTTTASTIGRDNRLGGLIHEYQRATA